MLVQKVLKWMTPLDSDSEDKKDSATNNLEYKHLSPIANASSTASTAATSLLTYGPEFHKNNLDDFDLADGDIRSSVSLKSCSGYRKVEGGYESFVSCKSDSGDKYVEVESAVAKIDVSEANSEKNHVQKNVQNSPEENWEIPMGAGDCGKLSSEVNLSPQPVPKKSCSTQTKKKKRRQEVKAKTVPKKEVQCAPGVSTTDASWECNENTTSKVLLKELDHDVCCAGEHISPKLTKDKMRIQKEVQCAPAVSTADASCECKENTTPKVLLKELDHDFFCAGEPIRPKLTKDRMRIQKMPESEPFEGVYGELAVLGCNGGPPDRLNGLMQSRYCLSRRSRPNGVKEAYSFVSSHKRPVPRSSGKFSVSYHVSSGRSVVVEYTRDLDTDMFQIGRFETDPVDFRVQDVKGTRNGVSRFACRILVQRRGRHEARLYAAAFDPTGNIFLGEGAQTCVRDGKMDGFTTNGVLMMHPRTRPLWREVSVCGFVYPLRSPALDARKRPRIADENNVLQDGTLIDLCGVTLVWRTPNGLRAAPTRVSLSRVEYELKSWTPEYEIPPRMPLEGRKSSHAVVFQSCGHVMNLFGCEKMEPLESWTCPVCRAIGPLSKLEVGMEPCFYVDCGFLTHAFRPCGHATSLKTVLYWAAMKIPEHRTFQDGLCPFCGVKLNFISKYVELKYPE